MLAKSKIANAAGTRNNYITIQRATDNDADSTGTVTQTFSDWFSRWAGYKPTGGREFLAAMQVQPMLTQIAELPYDELTKQISPKDQVTDDGRTQNIAAVFNENENNEKIILWLIEPVEG